MRANSNGYVTPKIQSNFIRPYFSGEAIERTHGTFERALTIVHFVVDFEDDFIRALERTMRAAIKSR